MVINITCLIIQPCLKMVPSKVSTTKNLFDSKLKYKQYLGKIKLYFILNNS